MQKTVSPLMAAAFRKPTGATNTQHPAGRLTRAPGFRPMSYHDERRAEYESRLPLMHEIAAALGGTLMTTLHRERYSPDSIPGEWEIYLPGELFSLAISRCWMQQGRISARLEILRPDGTPQSVHANKTATFSPERPPADLAADIRRRVIEPNRAAAIADHGRQIARDRHRIAKEATRQELSRLLRVPDLKEYRGTSPGWTARGFEISDYDLENITEGKPVHCRIAVPLDAFRLIAPIIAACYPQP